MARIEFIKEEPYCRFDGIMMSDEAFKELFGFEGELDILDNDTYQIDGVVYTNKKLGDLIKLFGEIHSEVEEYDEILSQGRGFAAHCAEEKLNNTIVILLKDIEHLKMIKPFNDFVKDYPNANVKKYIEFMDCLNAYYEK